MKKKWLKITNWLIPYATISLGLILILFIPLSFYSSKNLEMPMIVKPQITKADTSSDQITGGDVFYFPASQPVAPVAKNNDQYNRSLSASSAMVLDVGSRNILFSKNEKQIRPLASITKLMSAIILLGLPMDWSVTTTIAETDGNGDQHVQPGEAYTLEDLWGASLVGSSNRATRALVKNSGLQEEGFVMLMNKKAKELGLNSLYFTEPTGLSAKNVGNAVDVANLLKEALRFDKIYKFLQIDEYYVRPLNKDKLRRIWSTDWLLTNWTPNNFTREDIVGKTGYIAESGYNFVVSLTDKNRHQLICVILGSISNEQRFEEARDLSEWVFAKYVWPGDQGYEELVE